MMNDVARVHPAAMDVEALLAQCQVRKGRRRGPGGQHRNKVETAVTITHQVSSVSGYAAERRSASENHHVALFRLRLNLAIELRGYFDLRDVPSPLWQSRRTLPRPSTQAAPPWDRLFKGGQGKIAVNPGHHDYPALLAEAMDVLAATSYEPAKAAAVLGVTSSQLIKLVKDEPRALAWVNQQREGRGGHGLK